MVHGAAGSSPFGLQQNLWAPAATGRDFDLSPTSLKSLEPFRDHITIVSNTDVPSADPTEAREIGGDHFRSSAAYLTQSYPKRTDGADVECGISMDQLYAQRFGQDTPLPSMQLCIESVDQSGGCGYGYSCVYTDAHQLVGAEQAAADDPRPARGLRSDVQRVRVRRLARRAPRAAIGRPQHPGLRAELGEAPGCSPRRPPIAPG